MAATTSTYAHDNAAIAKYGRWTTDATYLIPTADNSQAWFRFYGNKLELNAYATSGACQVSIDGGAFSTVTLNTSTPGYVQAWTGVEGWHNAIVSHNASGGTRLVKTAAIRVTGTDGNQQIGKHTDSGVYERLRETPFTTYGIQTYATTSTDPTGYTSPSVSSPIVPDGIQENNSIIRRKATWVAGSKIMAWMFYSGKSFNLRIDGVQWGLYTAKAGDGDAGYGFVVADLPGSGSHEIELVVRNQTDAIMITDAVGGTGASFDSTASSTPSTKMSALGDSQTAGFGTNLYPGMTYDALLSLNSDIHVHNVGISGDTVAQMTARFATSVTQFAPQQLIILAGYNNASGPGFTSLRSDYKALLDKAIADLPSLQRIYCMKITNWTNQASVNSEIEAAISEWLSINTTWASKLTIITPVDTDVELSHISGIGYTQMHGDNTASIKFAGQPSDGDTVTLVSRGVTKIFEFDNNASVSGGNISVTIGANATATNLNLFTAINAQYEAGWYGKPLTRINDGQTIGCAVSRVASIAKSGTNISVFGPYRDGVSTVIREYTGYRPARAWTNISGETASSLALGTVDKTSHGRQFRCVATNSVGSATSDTANLTVN